MTDDSQVVAGYTVKRTAEIGEQTGVRIGWRQVGEVWG